MPAGEQVSVELSLQQRRPLEALRARHSLGFLIAAELESQKLIDGRGLFYPKPSHQN